VYGRSANSLGIVLNVFAPRPSPKSMIPSGGEKVKGPGGFGNRVHTNARPGLPSSSSRGRRYWEYAIRSHG